MKPTYARLGKCPTTDTFKFCPRNFIDETGPRLHYDNAHTGHFKIINNEIDGLITYVYLGIISLISANSGCLHKA